MTNSTYISNQFDVWEKCRKQYYYKYVKKLILPEQESNYKLGREVHALINYYLKGFNIEHLLKHADEDVIKLWNTIKDHNLLKNKIIATEWSFNSRIKDSNYWLNGRIDAVFYDKAKNNCILVDWKTGQNIPENPEYNYQCMIYLYSFFKGHKDFGLNLNQNEMIFQFVKISDSIDIISIPYSGEKQEEYEKIFLEKIMEIESEKEFDKINPCKTKFCQYKRFCNSESY